jgi:hypothetical protein
MSERVFVLFPRCVVFTQVLLWLWNAPGVVIDYSWPATAPTSALYRVTITQAGVTNVMTTHFSKPNLNPGPDGNGVTGVLQDRSLSFVQFAFTGEIDVEVKKLYGATAPRVEIAPKAYAIDPYFFDGRTVRFKLSPAVGRPEYISVNFVTADNQDDDGAGGKDIKNGMMLFGDAPETDVPDTNVSGVVVYGPAVSAAQLAAADIIYFPPGDHDLLARYPANPRMASLPVGKNGQKIYAAGGAFIRGAIHSNGRDNLRVYGRGIFTGQFLYWHAIRDSGGLKDAFMRFLGSDNCLFEGVLIENPTHHTWPSSSGNTYRNTKIIGWASNHDGFRPGGGSVIEEVFIKTSDDYDYARDPHVGRSSVIWPMRNGAFGQLGWNNLGTGFTTYSNLYFINAEWHSYNRNRGVIGSVTQQGINLQSNRLENLYCENFLSLLANITIQFESGDPWNAADPGWIRRFTFKNIILENTFKAANGTIIKNPLKGFTHSSGVKAMVHDISFVNLIAGNVLITSNNAATYFDIDPNTTSNITFSISGPIYYVTNSATAGGTLSPSGTVPTPAGMTRTIAITANTGQRIKNVRVDGVDLGRRQNVTFPNISANHTVHVEFEAAANDYFNLTPVDTNTPPAPSALTVVPVASVRLDLAWTDNATNEQNFQLERALSVSGPWTNVAILSANTTNLSDEGLVPLTEYFYRVRAANAAGPSPWSNTNSATTLASLAGAPTNLMATAGSSSSIRLQWTDVAVGESGIELQSAAAAAGPWAALATLAPNSQAYTNTGLSSGTEQFYRARAVFPGDVSAWSDVASATTFNLAGGGYTNVDLTMLVANWRPATNPNPPGVSAMINFSSATNLTYTWSNAGGTNATLTYTITRADTNGPGGADVLFFGPAVFSGTATNLRLVMDVSKSPANIGTLRFAVRQGTNLFQTSSGLNNIPGTSGIIVNYELTGLTTLTLKTNGVTALAGLTWTSKFAGTTLNFTNGLPIEFGFQCDGALGATATTGQRGPILDNYRVEVGALGDGIPPVVQINSPTNGQVFLLYAPVDVAVTVTDNSAVAEARLLVDGAEVSSLSEPPFDFTSPPLAAGAHTLGVVGFDESGNSATNSVSVSVIYPPRGPQGGVASTIPGVIEAEHFDLGGPGLAYNDTTPANQGGDYRVLEGVDIEETQDADGSYNLGWMQNGEWLEYTVNVTGGYYDLSARVASANGSPGDLRVSLNGTVLGTFDVTSTGDVQDWATLVLPQIALVDGTNRVLRLEVVNGGAGDQFNLNWISFTPTANPPAPVITHALTGGQFIFTWPTVPGWQYQVEYKTNLTQAAWETWGGPETAAGFRMSRTNPLAGAAQSYFRVQEIP